MKTDKKQSCRPAPAWTQVDEIEIVYRTKMKANLRPRITCSRDGYNLLLQAWNPDSLELQEEVKLLLLNRDNRVLGLCNISRGGMTGTVADPRLILLVAIKAGACSVMLAHNHPSGSLHPSRADEELTQKIKFASIYHDIKVLDHLIITATGYYSFADEGLL